MCVGVGGIREGQLPSSPAVHTCLCVSQAIWENQFYYLFGFLYLVFVILVIACAEVSIAMTYFQLCAEVSPAIRTMMMDKKMHLVHALMQNYHWWWRSFFISGSPSYYVLAYSVVYYFTKVRERG